MGVFWQYADFSGSRFAYIIFRRMLADVVDDAGERRHAAVRPLFCKNIIRRRPKLAVCPF